MDLFHTSTEFPGCLYYSRLLQIYDNDYMTNEFYGTDESYYLDRALPLETYEYGEPGEAAYEYAEPTYEYGASKVTDLENNKWF